MSATTSVKDQIRSLQGDARGAHTASSLVCGIQFCLAAQGGDPLPPDHQIAHTALHIVGGAYQLIDQMYGVAVAALRDGATADDAALMIAKCAEGFRISRDPDAPEPH